MLSEADCQVRRSGSPALPSVLVDTQDRRPSIHSACARTQGHGATVDIPKYLLPVAGLCLDKAFLVRAWRSALDGLVPSSASNPPGSPWTPEGPLKNQMTKVGLCLEKYKLPKGLSLFGGQGGVFHCRRGKGLVGDMASGVGRPEACK